ncbi:MAG TPA: hypothetical protein VL175_04825 [Pirellulales bacterium]|jgi:hypothetical protein|nr:hypothetical protein [Pirellulales bacterium]
MYRAALFALVVFPTALACAETPLDVGNRKQLFIDQRFIAASERVTLRTNPAQKLGPILDADGKPLHGHVSRVIEDQNKIRMYVGHDGVAIFESDDGLHFKATGASIGGGSFSTIFLDPHEPNPERRYKLFLLKSQATFDRARDGVYAFTSKDGLHFSEVGRVLPRFTDNPTIVLWDARIEKYVVYLRALAYDSPNQRRIARIELDDPLAPWPFRESNDPRPFLSTENVPVVLAADSEDDPESDIYYNAATIYEAAQDTYLMFTTQFRHFSPQRHPFVRAPRPGEWEDFGPLEVQLAVSRDGVHWQRPTREPYFPMGLPDEWDRWYAVMGPGLARRGNYLYQYYNSSGRLHDGAILRAEYEKSAPQLGGIGIVRQRLDGFVSADADHKGGWLQTPLLTYRGNRLRLNIDTGAMGTALVELRDGEGQPIPGFTLDDCEEIGGNFIDQLVYWKGSADVGSLAGRPIRVYMKLKRAKLYAFQFTAE